MSQTEVGGRAVGFRREQGEGPTLVLMHGAAGNHHVYDRLLDALPGVASVAVDRPGRLESEGPPLETIEAQAAFMQSFVDAQVEGDYVWVGHSLGGALAIELALTRPSSSLKGLVLVSTGARLRVHPGILTMFEQLVASDTPAGLTPGLTSPGTNPDVEAELARGLAMTPPGSGLVDWRSADTFDRMSRLASIDVPTLVFGGLADALTPPKYARYLAENVSQSELHLFEEAGHMLVMERAGEVARVLRAFHDRL